LRLVVADPGQGADGITFTASKAQAQIIRTAWLRSVTLFHLESRNSITKLFKASRRAFKKLLREQRPDVVHVHFGSVAALFSVLLSNVPVVITFMGDDLDRRGRSP
jgi:UDP-N-acetylglucosamine:LPS N-acetylglucosamine transferase